MNSMRWFLIAMAAALMIGCGSNDPAPGSVADSGERAEAAARTPTGDATAEEVAAEARGKLRCPPKLDTPARDAAAPVDDIVGVRPGQTYDEAAALVMCSNELMVVTPESRRGFQIQTYGEVVRQGFNGRIAKARVQRSSEQIMKEMQDAAMARGTNRVVRDMAPGESKFYVTTMGMPGDERVIAVAREEWFAEGRNPTVASVRDALAEKYGTPTADDMRNGGYLTWGYDPQGRPITETSPLFQQCRSQPDPDAGLNLTPDCGVVITARLQPLQSNPDLAEFMQVSVADQAGGFESISAVEQGLQQRETERRAQQVQDAAQNADAPTL